MFALVENGGDPDMIKTSRLAMQVPDYLCLHPSDSSCEEHMHWWSHVEVPNSNSISCLNSSLLEYPGSIPGRDMFVSGALVEDGDDLGRVFL